MLHAVNTEISLSFLCGTIGIHFAVHARITHAQRCCRREGGGCPSFTHSYPRAAEVQCSLPAETVWPATGPLTSFLSTMPLSPLTKRTHFLAPPDNHPTFTGSLWFQYLFVLGLCKPGSKKACCIGAFPHPGSGRCVLRCRLFL